MANGWDIKCCPNNGSKTQYADASHSAVIWIQGNAQGNLEATVQQLAHELYHAYNPTPPPSREHDQGCLCKRHDAGRGFGNVHGGRGQARDT